MVILSEFTARVRCFIKTEASKVAAVIDTRSVEIVGVQISAIDGVVNVALHAKAFDLSRPPRIPEYTHTNISVLVIDEWDAEYWSGRPEVMAANGTVYSNDEGDGIYCREFVQWGGVILEHLSMEASWPFPSAYLAAEAVGMEPVLLWKPGKFPVNI